MCKEKINSHERFVRWHQVLREHITFLNNLLLTISIGIVGFLFSLISEKSNNLNCSLKIFLFQGAVLIFISVFSGFFTTLSRLFDFRSTLKKIKSEIKEEIIEMDELKYLMKMYGKLTWVLLYIQVISFILSMIFFTIVFFISLKLV